MNQEMLDMMVEPNPRIKKGAIDIIKKAQVDSIPKATTPMEMLALAVSQGAELDKITKLMDFQDRWESNEARKAFVAAMTRFKADPPKIVKDKQVAFGNTKYKHAELDQVSGMIGLALAKVGISHRWNIEQADGKIAVTCHLVHALGHTESVRMEAPADVSGQKNPIQAIASTISYLERYTILAATGTATGEDDYDGRMPSGPIMPEDVFQGHIRAMESAKSVDELQKAFSTAYKSATDKDTQKALMNCKDVRKMELSK